MNDFIMISVISNKKSKIRLVRHLDSKCINILILSISVIIDGDDDVQNVDKQTARFRHNVS